MKPYTTSRTLQPIFTISIVNLLAMTVYVFFHFITLFHDCRQDCLIEVNAEYEKVPYHLANNRPQENSDFSDYNHA